MFTLCINLMKSNQSVSRNPLSKQRLVDDEEEKHHTSGSALFPVVLYAATRCIPLGRTSSAPGRRGFEPSVCDHRSSLSCRRCVIWGKNRYQVSCNKRAALMLCQYWEGISETIPCIKRSPLPLTRVPQCSLGSLSRKFRCWLSVCLSACLSACLSVCLSVPFFYVHLPASMTL